MRQSRSHILLLLAMTLIVPAAAWAQDPVVFNDPALEAAVREALTIPTEPIMPAHMLNLTQLVARNKGIADLTGLQYATNLTKLDLYGNNVGSLSPLAGLTALQDLQVALNQIADLSPLSGMVNLSSLNASGNQITNLEPLSGLSNLTSLHVGGNQIRDYAALVQLTNLSSLTLGRNPISDLTALSTMTGLTRLDLVEIDATDISVLSNLTGLSDLNLSKNPQISDFSVISALTNLTILSVSSNQLTDIDFVSGLTQLISLNCNGNEVAGINPLTDLTNLQNVNMSSNRISDITALSGLTALRVVTMNFNSISDLSPLAGLTNIQALTFNGNQIRDISALPIPASLRAVDLAGNRVVDLSRLTQVSGLTYLAVGRNPLGWWAYCEQIPVIQSNNPAVSQQLQSVLNSNPYDCGCQPEPTPEGSAVIVIPTDHATGTTPVTMTFENVASSGGTTLLTSTSGPEPRPGFQLGDPATYYEITTTASYTGLIDLRVSYAGVSFPGAPESLRLLHYEDGQWVDCTTVVDTQNETVCGVVTSLSPFAIMLSEDTTPPVFESLVATPNVLWPPNHGLIPITVTWSVTDNLDPDPAATLNAISMNEGDETNTYDPAFDTTVGDGHTVGDIEIDASGNIFLRAERTGTGAGRTYTLTYQATDALGNTATATVTVTVPHEAP